MGKKKDKGSTKNPMKMEDSGDVEDDAEGKGSVVTGNESLAELKKKKEEAEAAGLAAEARAKAFKELDLDEVKQISGLIPKARELYVSNKDILEAQDGDGTREERIEVLLQCILHRAKWPVTAGAPVIVRCGESVQRADGVKDGWKGTVIGEPDRSDDVRINWDHVKTGELDEESGFIKANILETHEWVPPEEIAAALQRVYASRTPRARAQQLVRSDSFEGFMLLLIVVSAAFIAMEDPTDDLDDPSDRTESLRQWGIFFNVLFTAEFGIKFFALGPKYLLSAWTILDIVIVTTGWLDVIAGTSSPLRIFRLLRPLRTIQRLPKLKLLVETLVQAMPQLVGIAGLLAMYFCIFAIIGLQLWSGKWRQRCKLSPNIFCDQEVCNVIMNPFADHKDLTCPCAIAQGDICEVGQFDSATGLITDNQNAFEWAHAKYGHIDFMSFDSFFDALPVVLHLVTKVGWTDLMNLTITTSGGMGAAYYITGVIFGGYMLVYFFVAVLKEQYTVAMAVSQEGETAFDHIDNDRNGTLERDELARVFLINGVFLGDAQIDARVWAAAVWGGPWRTAIDTIC